jgi:hypothetical protein
VANTFIGHYKWGLVVLRGKAIGTIESPALWATRPKAWPLSECRYRQIILLGFGMESAGVLDKACLRRLKGVRRSLGQSKV